MVQERSEPLLPIPSCCFAYPLERAWRVAPTLRLERVTLGRVPLASPLPSTASAAVALALFGGFSDTTEPSDFPRPFIIGVRP